MTYQLGHPPGESCLVSEQARGTFTVVHMNGIHSVNVNFCGCTKHSTPYNLDFPVDKQIQLLEVGWWPTTCLEPRSAVTFDAIKQFQLLNLHGSLAALEYYRMLEDLTSGDGIRQRKRKGTDQPKADVPPVRLENFASCLKLTILHRIDFNSL
jgi:hypothetical protein